MQKQVHSESYADGEVIGDGFTEEVIIEQHMLQANPAILNKAGNETNDPALLAGMKFSIEEKEKLCKNEPCQPPESVYVREKRKLENVTGTVRRWYFFMKIKLGASGFHIR